MSAGTAPGLDDLLEALDAGTTIRRDSPLHAVMHRVSQEALRRGVFVNAGCKIQDQGGVTIGDGALVGHDAVLTTLNHDLDPRRRADMHPAPVVVGRNVWLGANVTVLPGVTIGDDAVVGAGAVVTQDVPAGTVAVGVPARVVRSVGPEGRGAGLP